MSDVLSNTDSAVANVITQVTEAIKNLSGPTYDLLLATCQAQAHADIMQFWVISGFFIVVLVMVALLVTIGIAVDDDAFGPAFFLGLIGFILGVLVLANTPALAFNRAVIEHPQICIGKQVLERIGK